MYDVAVVGAGPAGSAVSSYLSKFGMSVALIERESFPRPHIGESLIPSANEVLMDLGIWEKMDVFVRKYQAIWSLSGEQADEQGFSFLNNSEEIYTYHVDRAVFDLMLLERAKELGTTLINDKVVGVETELDFHRLLLSNNDPIETKFLIDASGRTAFLGRKLRLLNRDGAFNQVSISGWFEGFNRKTDAIYIYPLSGNAWAWQIPISSSITSFGVVLDRYLVFKNNDKLFWDFISKNKELFDQLLKTSLLGSLEYSADFSYSLTEFVGENWAVVGDAAFFVDPIFSAGVSTALQGAKHLATALEKGEGKMEMLKTYANWLEDTRSIWRTLILIYHRLAPLFLFYLSEPSLRLQLSSLLQGQTDIETAQALLVRMGEDLAAVESNPAHPWFPLLGKAFGNLV